MQVGLLKCNGPSGHGVIWHAAQLAIRQYQLPSFLVRPQQVPLKPMCDVVKEEQKKLAQRLLREGNSVKQVAETFEVHVSTIYRLP